MWRSTELLFGISLLFVLPFCAAQECSSQLAGNQTLCKLESKARAGDPDAQYQLGLAFDKGSGIEQDCHAAADWYMQAAHHAHPAAQNNLAVLYATGCGVARDDKESAMWYMRSAAGGFAVAQNNLGYAYEIGRGVKQKRRRGRPLVSESGRSAVRAGAGESCVALHVRARSGEECCSKRRDWNDWPPIRVLRQPKPPSARCISRVGRWRKTWPLRCAGCGVRPTMAMLQHRTHSAN